jgi:hypothetical protein
MLLAGTTFTELDQAASFWFALMDTWRGGAPPHLRPHTCSRQLCELPPVTAPAPTGPVDSRGSRPGHKRPSNSKRHPLRPLRRRSPQARPGPTRRSSSCLIRRRRHSRQASNDKSTSRPKPLSASGFGRLSIPGTIQKGLASAVRRPLSRLAFLSANQLVLGTVTVPRTVSAFGDYFAVYRGVRSGRVDINALWSYCFNGCSDSMRWEASVRVA